MSIEGRIIKKGIYFTLRRHQSLAAESRLRQFCRVPDADIAIPLSVSGPGW